MLSCQVRKGHSSASESWTCWSIAFTPEEPSRKTISPTEPCSYLEVTLECSEGIARFLLFYQLILWALVCGWPPSGLVHTHLISFWHQLYEGGVISNFQIKKLTPKDIKIPHLGLAELGHGPRSSGSIMPPWASLWSEKTEVGIWPTGRHRHLHMT